MSSPTGYWTSRFGFLMASIGFAVGLGNIWRFPYMVGENGGSVFIVIYLLCAFLIGVPILMAEIMIGRRGLAPPEMAMEKVATESSLSTNWRMVGHLNLLTAFLILFVYSVVAGWVLFYFFQSLVSCVSGVGLLDQVGSFEVLQSDLVSLIFWSFLALAMTATILVFGVEKGIERVVTLLIPALVLLLLVLAAFNVLNGGMSEAIEYMFLPDFDEVHAGIFLAAVSQAFFSIGVAMGGMMVFGSYLPTNVSIGRSAVMIVSADTMIALLAGLVIFPLVFDNNLAPDSGTGLIFNTLPLAFEQVPFGRWVGLLFFLLLSMAAITSMVGFMEPIVASLIRRFQWTRTVSTILVSLCCFVFSIFSALSMSLWRESSVYGRSISDWLDFVPNSILLPLGGLLICIFAGWYMQPKYAKEELSLECELVFSSWRMSMKWLVAPVVLMILITGVVA